MKSMQDSVIRRTVPAALAPAWTKEPEMAQNAKRHLEPGPTTGRQQPKKTTQRQARATFTEKAE